MRVICKINHMVTNKIVKMIETSRLYFFALLLKGQDVLYDDSSVRVRTEPD